MINSDVTFFWKGYYPEDLKPYSEKKIWRVCDECGQGRWVMMCHVRNICKSCSAKQQVVAMSKAKIGTHLSLETRQKISKAGIGTLKPKSMLTRQRVSATNQGIPYEEWKAFARNQPYCPKFNEMCRESNRKKYGRECFLCGVAEKNNRDKTGRSKKLSVHHIDLDKTQGCNGHRWKLIPVCMHCHGRLHKEPWISRIQYLLVAVNISKQFEVK